MSSGCSGVSASGRSARAGMRAQFGRSRHRASWWWRWVSWRGISATRGQPETDSEAPGPGSWLGLEAPQRSSTWRARSVMLSHHRIISPARTGASLARDLVRGMGALPAWRWRMRVERPLVCEQRRRLHWIFIIEEVTDDVSCEAQLRVFSPSGRALSRRAAFSDRTRWSSTARSSRQVSSSGRRTISYWMIRAASLRGWISDISGNVIFEKQ
jgi:hypothetical protein